MNVDLDLERLDERKPVIGERTGTEQQRSRLPAISTGEMLRAEKPTGS